MIETITGFTLCPSLVLYLLELHIWFCTAYDIIVDIIDGQFPRLLCDPQHLKECLNRGHQASVQEGILEVSLKSVVSYLACHSYVAP